jgi:hypothetical protein
MKLNIHFKYEVKPLAFQRQILLHPKKYAVDLKDFYQPDTKNREKLVPRKNMRVHINFAEIWKGHIFNITLNAESWIEQRSDDIRLLGPIISWKKTNLNKTTAFKGYYSTLLAIQKDRANRMQLNDPKRAAEIRKGIPSVITNSDNFLWNCKTVDFTQQPKDVCITAMSAVSDKNRSVKSPKSRFGEVYRYEYEFKNCTDKVAFYAYIIVLCSSSNKYYFKIVSVIDGSNFKMSVGKHVSGDIKNYSLKAKKSYILVY